MQDFFIVFEIPANTSADNPVSVDVLVEGDELRRIAYLIPPGWHGLACFALYYGVEQIYPDRRGEWVSGDNVYKEVELRWKMPERKTILSILGYNTDSVYPHKVFIWLSTIDFEEDKVSWISSMLERISEWLGL
jgi:hypothetical protein